MTAGSGVHQQPPRSDGVPHPRRAVLAALRPAARTVISRRLDVRVHGAEHLPPRGPVILAANHMGVADGPLLAVFSPRPVHAMTKAEMFSGVMGWVLRSAGQVPVDRFHPDPRAVRSSLRVLREGRVLGIFPEGRRGCGDLQRFHRGAAYLALVTGAPVVPVVFLGTRAPGAHTDSVPPRGAVVDMVLGPPVGIEPQPWPRAREQVEHSSLFLREQMRAHLQHALAMTSRELPGPLPVPEVEPDPATGVTEQGAP